MLKTIAKKIVIIPFVLAAAIPVTAFAEKLTLNLNIENRQFSPQEIQLPPDTKALIIIHNKDSLPAEFESYDLSREVVVPPGASVNVYVGPLKEGDYEFFDDFNPAAKGKVIVTGKKED